MYKMSINMLKDASDIDNNCPLVVSINLSIK